jgi:RNA polymerase sigma-70 factor (ECF subfamily)
VTTEVLHACTTGDLDGLVRLLADDAVLYADGGGKARAALAPIRGADRVARFFLGVLKKWPAGLEIRRALVNGQPGFVARVADQYQAVLTFDVDGGRIRSCFIVSNPDKLARVQGADDTHPQNP